MTTRYTLIEDAPSGEEVVTTFTTEDTLNNPFLDPAVTTTTTTTVTARNTAPYPDVEVAFSRPSGYDEPVRRHPQHGIYEELPLSPQYHAQAQQQQQQHQQQQPGSASGANSSRHTAASEPDDSVSETQSVPILTGQLPDDFLRLTERVPVPRHPTSHGLDPAFGTHAMHQPRQGIIRMNVLQAKLAKNYGFVKMDPFCRFISGPFHKATSVCVKGGKEPRWNQILDIPVLYGTENIRVEMYDMGTFSDSMIAWGDIDISELEPAIPLEKWFHLSGKQGEDKEGVILLRLVLQPTAVPPLSYPIVQTGYPGQTIVYQMPSSGMYGGEADVYMSYPAATTIVSGPPLAYPSQRVIMQQQQPLPQGPPRPAPIPQSQPQAQPAQSIRADDVRQLREMFPTMDEEIVKSVLLANNGNVEASLNALLSMASVS